MVGMTLPLRSGERGDPIRSLGGGRGSDPPAVRGEMRKAEGESAGALHGAGLGASPSVAARQLPLGGSDLGGGVRAALVVAWLGVSPSVAARQLPLGGSDLGGGVRAALVVACLGVSPQSLRDSSPSGGAIWEGECVRPSLWRGWESPPQSLRDSSPSGGAIGSILRCATGAPRREGGGLSARLGGGYRLRASPRGAAWLF